MKEGQRKEEGRAEQRAREALCTPLRPTLPSHGCPPSPNTLSGCSELPTLRKSQLGLERAACSFKLPVAGMTRVGGAGSGTCLSSRVLPAVRRNSVRGCQRTDDDMRHGGTPEKIYPLPHCFAFLYKIPHSLRNLYRISKL